MLLKLEPTEQSPVHHPEGNVLNHTLLVVDEAAKRRQESDDPRAFMWAALLHDIGKPATTRYRKGKITAYDHDKVGAELTREFLSAVTDDRQFIDKVVHLVKYHMQLLYVVKDLPFKDIGGMKRHSDIKEVALLCLCDRLGRDGADRESEEEQVKTFVNMCENK
jgi:putative nucleotidyltransferase with HDIG domain